MSGMEPRMSSGRQPRISSRKELRLSSGGQPRMSGLSSSEDAMGKYADAVEEYKKL